MQAITTDKVYAWCNQHSINVSDGGPERLYFDSKHIHGIEVPITADRDRLIFLAYEMVFTDVEGAFEETYSMLEDHRFTGALFWLTDYNIYGSERDMIGLRIIDRMRRGYGIQSGLDESPGHLFDSSEYHDQVAFIALTALVGWDGYLVPTSGDYYIHISHHELAIIVPRTSDHYHRLWDKFSNDSPKECRFTIR